MTTSISSKANQYKSRASIAVVRNRHHSTLYDKIFYLSINLCFPSVVHCIPPAAGSIPGIITRMIALIGQFTSNCLPRTETEYKLFEKVKEHNNRTCRNYRRVFRGKCKKIKNKSFWTLGSKDQG